MGPCDLPFGISNAHAPCLSGFDQRLSLLGLSLSEARDNFRYEDILVEFPSFKSAQFLLGKRQTVTPRAPGTSLPSMHIPLQPLTSQ